MVASVLHLCYDVVWLQEHHQAEQQELLEKQYEEHLALMELHEEARGYRRSRATAFKHAMQHPLMLLLSCTMPRVSRVWGSRVAKGGGTQRCSGSVVHVQQWWIYSQMDQVLCRQLLQQRA